jgi:hypothetical protein
MMKHLYTLLIVLLTQSASAKIVEGGWDSGGGSGFAAEFISIARDLAPSMDSLVGFPVTKNQFLNAIQSSKVEFINGSLSNSGQDVDAISNRSQNLIQVTEKAWYSGWTADIIVKRRLVLHQYLLLMNIDDYDFMWTNFYLNGGKTIRSFTCSTGWFNSGDRISLTLIDTDGDNQSDKAMAHGSFIRLAKRFDQTPEVVTTEQGVVVSWAELTGTVAALFPHQDLQSGRSFKVKLSKITSYPDSGAPIVKNDGSLSCEPN